MNPLPREKYAVLIPVRFCTHHKRYGDPCSSNFDSTEIQSLRTWIEGWSAYIVPLRMSVSYQKPLVNITPQILQCFLPFKLSINVGFFPCFYIPVNRSQ